MPAPPEGEPLACRSSDLLIREQLGPVLIGSGIGLKQHGAGDDIQVKERVVKNVKMLGTARGLRRKMTPQERKLWYTFLKDYPVKIYKQRIIESFVVDFYCASAHLVIEVDGLIHLDRIERDQSRSIRLQKYDLEVLSFSNEEIETHFHEVCSKIDHVIQERRAVFAEEAR